MIPKVIHYCWFGKKPLPELVIKCLDSWKIHCPDFQIIRWDETNIDLSSCKFAKQAYDAGKWAFVSDYVRLKVIYDNGGIYLDTDVELIKPLTDMLIYPAYFGLESNKDGWHINSGLGFGAVKGHSYIFTLLHEYEDIEFMKDDGTYNLTPCPIRETDVLIREGYKPDGQSQMFNNIMIFSSDYFSPISMTGQRNFTKNTHSIHHYNASWFTEIKQAGLKRKRLLIRLFGEFIGAWINKPFILIDELRERGWREIILRLINLVTNKN